MRKALIVLAAVFSSLAALPASAAPAGPAGQLRVEILADKALYQGDSDITVTVKVSNPAATSLSVPAWQLPSEDLPTPIVNLTAADGTPAPYTGPLVKWDMKAPAVTFAPGASRVYKVELTALYDIGNGRYRIDYSQDGPGKYDPSGRTARVFAPISPVYIETQGRSPRKQAVTLAPAPTVASLTTQRCTASQQSTITTAVANATSYSQGANSYFNTNTVATTRYITWFGVANASRWATAKDHFTSITAAFTGQPVTVDCSCKKKTVYAYVYANQPYVIYVCGAFWTAPTLGTDSKAGTLIHEMSHFTVVAGTSDYVYGQSGAKSLAISDPAKAVFNADSHEYFAENTPFLN